MTAFLRYSFEVSIYTSSIFSLLLFYVLFGLSYKYLDKQNMKRKRKNRRKPRLASKKKVKALVNDSNFSPHIAKPIKLTTDMIKKIITKTTSVELKQFKEI